MPKTALLFLLLFIPALSFAAPLKTERVILVTADGLRHQELFNGVDPLLLEKAQDKDKAIADKVGIDTIPQFKKQWVRDTPQASREAIFPFFWGTLAKQGIVLGNIAKGSSVKVLNNNRVSYPGYAEILTGKPQPRIWDNLDIPNPQTTVLEFAQQKLGLDYKGVAAITSWNKFNLICAHNTKAFYINAGFEKVPEDLATPGMEPLNSLQFNMLTPWDSVRFDTVTLNLALEYIKAHQPRLFYLSLGETDDWAHDARYDRVIHACNLFDDALRQLWETLQSLYAYRDKTTLVITVDHGRGKTEDNWQSHGKQHEGADDIWAAVIGPDTPDKGELENVPQHTQGQAAATVAKFLGLDYNAEFPDTAPPIAEAFPD